MVVSPENPRDIVRLFAGNVSGFVPIVTFLVGLKIVDQYDEC